MSKRLQLVGFMAILKNKQTNKKGHLLFSHPSKSNVKLANISTIDCYVYLLDFEAPYL